MIRLFRRIWTRVTRPMPVGARALLTTGWTFRSVEDKKAFLSWILEQVPDGSVWSIEGAGPNVWSALKPYSLGDVCGAARGTIWPVLKRIEIRLDVDSRGAVREGMPQWDLDHDCVHQSIFEGSEYYFIAYDNIDAKCTWVSRSISEDAIDSIVQRGIVVPLCQ